MAVWSKHCFQESAWLFKPQLLFKIPDVKAGDGMLKRFLASAAALDQGGSNHPSILFPALAPNSAKQIGTPALLCQAAAPGAEAT